MLRVKIREVARVRNKMFYLALAVLSDGAGDVLGIWIEQTEGAAGQRHPHRRGRTAQRAIVGYRNGAPADRVASMHLMRSSLDYDSWKERKPIAAALVIHLCSRDPRGCSGLVAKTSQAKGVPISYLPDSLALRA